MIKFFKRLFCPHPIRYEILEVCEQVDVDEIEYESGCYKGENNWTYCYIDSMEKKDIIPNWLNENAECIELTEENWNKHGGGGIQESKEEAKEHMEDSCGYYNSSFVFTDERKLDNGKFGYSFRCGECSKYKIRDYTIEVE